MKNYELKKIRENETAAEQAVEEAGTSEAAKADGGAAPHGKVKRYVRIAFACLGYALLALLAVILVWMLVEKYVKKSPAPGAFGYSPLLVATGSMSGTIEAGDMVIIHAREEYCEGDIITFLPEGDAVPTTHRIVEVCEDGTFITRGDANNANDSDPVSADRVLGAVVGVIPGVGIFIRWVSEANGWVFFAIGAVLIGAGIYVFCKRDA